MDWFVYLTFGWLFASVPAAWAFGRMASLTGGGENLAEDAVLERASREIRDMMARRASGAPPAPQATSPAPRAETANVVAKDANAKRKKKKSKAA